MNYVFFDKIYKIFIVIFLIGFWVFDIVIFLLFKNSKNNVKFGIILWELFFFKIILV